jgi:tRNA A-37 threonylcarbamoyl transferase component Bud32
MEQVEMIGRYIVLYRLEVGERYAVYLAEDPILMRQVAIKVLRQGRVEKGRALARLRRAAEVARAVKHPNIVGVFEVGEDAVAGPFVVMEFVDGPSLADLAEVGSLDLEIRLRWLLQIMRALEAAHASGIVHGNVNQGNVLVSREQVAKLMGFSLGADLAAPGSDETIHSIDIAPELHYGAGASAATDRYTFSVIALELMNEEWAQSAQSSSADVGKVGAEALGACAGVQPSLVAVFDRALAEDPGDRFVDLESFMRELIDASPLDVSARARLRTALSVRPLVTEETLAPSARHAARSAGANERAQIAPYQRALALAMVGMAVVAAVAVGMSRLTSEVPEPASARKLYVISAPQGATIMVDAKRLGETPRRVFVDPEARRIRLEKKGYRPADFSLRDGRDDIRLTMEPLPAEARRARARLARKKHGPTVLASPDKEHGTGGLFVLVGRGLESVGDGFARLAGR